MLYLQWIKLEFFHLNEVIASSSVRSKLQKENRESIYLTSKIEEKPF